MEPPVGRKLQLLDIIPKRMTRAGLIVALLAITITGVARAERVPPPEQPERGIAPGEYPAAPPRDPVSVPEDILARREHLSLADVLDVALANDPSTRIAWRDARARAAAIGIEKAEYYPQIEASYGATRSHTVIQGGRLESGQTTYGPGAPLDCLLLDFGQR